MYRMIHRLAPGGLILCLLLTVGCDVPPPPRSDPPSVDAAPRSLHEAVRVGDRAALRRHFEQGADLNEPDGSGWPLLHLAIAMEQPDTVRQLLEWGASAGGTDSYGSTPLHVAAGQGQVHVARLLIQRGADVAATDESGFTPADIAHVMGHDGLVTYLVAAGADDPRDKPTPDAERMVPTHTRADVREPRAPPFPENEFRVWTNTDQEETRAALVEVLEDMVVLRTPDERILRVPIRHLRADDREAVRGGSRSERNAHGGAL